MKMDFQLIPGTTPERQFKDHESVVTSVAIFPDRRRMVTGSLDNTLRVWDLKTGVVLNKMVGHRGGVWGLAVSRDGKLIASGDNNGDLIAWHGATGEYLTQVMEAHSTWIEALDFSPGGTTLATSGSQDRTTRLWSTESWQEQGNPIKCSDWVRCIRYSPSGELLAIATDSNIEIYNPSTRECIVKFKGHIVINVSLAWTPDSTRLLSGGNYQDPSIREWNTSTWQQVGDAWTGHINAINAITVHPTGRLVASASTDSHIRLWRLSDRRTIAIFQRSSLTQCITFSVDGRHILSGGDDNVISEWAVPRDALSEEFIKKPASKVFLRLFLVPSPPHLA
jgi:WD40 repeat protein